MEQVGDRFIWPDGAVAEVVGVDDRVHVVWSGIGGSKQWDIGRLLKLATNDDIGVDYKPATVSIVELEALWG